MKNVMGTRGRTDSAARLSRAVALSLLVHLLVFGGLGHSPGFTAQGARPGQALAVRLNAARENAAASPVRLADSVKPAEVLPHAPPVTEAVSKPSLLENAPSGSREAPMKIDETFFTRSQLTAAPIMLTEPVFGDPDSLPLSGDWTGRAVLRLFIDREGRVVDVQGISPEDENAPALERIIAAFRAARFSPGEIDGIAVNSQIPFEVVVDDEAPASSRAGGHPF